MDHGTLTDANGKKVDFRNVVLIMTTNAGASDSQRNSIGFGRGKLEGQDEEAIKKLFTPEFRNRLDAIVAFKSLTPEVIRMVVQKFILQLEAQLADRHVTIETSDEAIDWLAKNGFDELYGARPLARVIQEQIKRPLADDILFGRLAKGGHVKVVLKDGKLAFEFDAKAVPPPVGDRPSEDRRGRRRNQALGSSAPAPLQGSSSAAVRRSWRASSPVRPCRPWRLRRGGRAAHPRQRGMIWTCRWKIVWPAAAPLNWVTMIPSGCSASTTARATRWVVDDSEAPSAVRRPADCAPRALLWMTRACPRAWGKASMNARVSASSKTLAAASSPRTILAKMLSGRRRRRGSCARAFRLVSTALLARLDEDGGSHARTQSDRAPEQVVRLRPRRARARHRQDDGGMGRDRQDLPGDRASRPSEVVQGAPTACCRTGPQVLGEAFGSSMSWRDAGHAHRRPCGCDPACARHLRGDRRPRHGAAGRRFAQRARATPPGRGQVQFAAARPIKGGGRMLGLAAAADADRALESPQESSPGPSA